MVGRADYALRVGSQPPASQEPPQEDLPSINIIIPIFNPSESKSINFKVFCVVALVFIGVAITLNRLVLRDQEYCLLTCNTSPDFSYTNYMMKEVECMSLKGEHLTLCKEAAKKVHGIYQACCSRCNWFS